MPIYEFYCSRCNTLYSFLSKAVNTTKRPSCPGCGKPKLQRQVSAFAVTGEAKEDGGLDDLPFDESRMEQAITRLAGDAESMNEDDPRQAARLMRKFSRMTGMEFGEGMEEAIGRMESGEDPEKIEAEMGAIMENEDPFVLPGKKGGGRLHRAPPRRDETLYEM